MGLMFTCCEKGCCYCGMDHRHSSCQFKKADKAIAELESMLYETIFICGEDGGIEKRFNPLKIPDVYRRYRHLQHRGILK